MSDEVEAVRTGKDHVSLEESFLGSWDVLTLLVHVLLGKTEIDHLDFVEVILMVLYRFGVANHNVIEFEVVESVTGLMSQLYLLK